MQRAIGPIIAACMACLPLAAFSQTGDEGLCADRDAEPTARLAACEALIPAQRDDPDALEMLGRAQRDADDPAAAIATFGEALALDDAHYGARSWRVLAHEDLEDWQSALDDLEILAERHPDDVWVSSRTGRVLRRSGEPARALDELARCRALDPDYVFCLTEISAAHGAMGDLPAAAAAYREATWITPFSLGRQRRAHDLFEDAGMLEEAAFHARVILGQNLNDHNMADWLQAHDGPRDPAPVLPPLAFAMPPEGIWGTYMHTRGPHDARTDVERSIDGLMTFFINTTYPRPDYYAIARIGRGQSRADVLRPLIEIIDADGSQGASLRRAPLYRGLFQAAFLPFGGDGPPSLLRFTPPGPETLWPLEAGRTGAGTAQVGLPCPPLSDEQRAAAGCEDGQRVKVIGALDWAGQVSTEWLRVPAGRIATYRIDFDLTLSTMLDGTQDVETSRQSFWIDPARGFWVARGILIDGIYDYSELMEDAVAP